MLHCVLLLSAAAVASAYNAPFVVQRSQALKRGAAVHMDETIMEKALAGELEEEGLENHWLSEVGWASWLDENAQSSYNMNERFSQANDGYTTPDIFSSPIDVVGSWLSSLGEVVEDPLGKAFPTITNDQTGNRAYPKGLTEINARTIKPKTKDWDKGKRTVGIPDWNMFGAPWSKLKDNLKNNENVGGR